MSSHTRRVPVLDSVFSLVLARAYAVYRMLIGAHLRSDAVYDGIVQIRPPTVIPVSIDELIRLFQREKAGKLQSHPVMVPPLPRNGLALARHRNALELVRARHCE